MTILAAKLMIIITAKFLGIFTIKVKILLMFYKRYCDMKSYSVCKSAIGFHIPKTGKDIIKYN